MNGKVFTITGHLRGASENHSKLSQVPTLAQTLKINGIALWVPWAGGTSHVLSLCDMAGTPEELCHSV